MWNSVAELHAALNDLPAALFVAAVVFDIAGGVTKRDSLRAAGFWSLIGAAVGAVLAVISGLSAEDVIEHGSVVHRSIERHQTLAISFTLLIVSLAVWRSWQRGTLPHRPRHLYVALTALGVIGLFWTAGMGGRIMFQYAGGIETRILKAAVAERAAGHVHEPGEAEHEHAPGEAEHEHPDGDDHPGEHVDPDHQH